jgi:hypothetical protein
VTVLSERGTPTPVAWTRLRAPRSLMAQLAPELQRQPVTGSALQAEYGRSVDRDSADEKLAARLAPAAAGGDQTSAPAAFSTVKRRR